jgi:hypothetical protein
MYLTRKLGVSFFLIAVIALSAAELWVVSAFGIAVERRSTRVADC